MSKLMLPGNLTRGFHKVGFTVKKHSPEILIAAGVVGTVASTVLACRATTKIGNILEKTKSQAALINEGAEKGQVAGVPYSPEDAKKDLTITYAKTAVDIAKLYAPAVILGALSITSILASHNILRKRNLALAAAYATVDGSFKEYRGRVIERFGKELDKELKYNIKTKEIEETTTDEEGNEVVVKKTVQVAEPSLYSHYARCFDETCPNWQKNAEHNLYFLMQQQNWANDRLKRRGYLYLNEVYEALGFQQTKAGQVVGWIYNEKNPVGDNFIDFGIHDINKEVNRNFVNGYERSIWVDFNVDGNIWELMS